MRDDLRKFHIGTCVRDALSRHGIPHDSPLREKLQANATISAGTDSHVVMKNGNSLDAEIENWLSSRRPAGSFSTSWRTVGKNDTESVQDHFADIAAGRLRVTD